MKRKTITATNAPGSVQSGMANLSPRPTRMDGTSRTARRAYASPSSGMSRKGFLKTAGIAAAALGASAVGLGGTASAQSGPPAGAIPVYPNDQFTPAKDSIEEVEYIQGVIDGAEPGSVIYFHPGTYLWGNCLRIKKSVTLMGPEPTNIQRHANGAVVAGEWSARIEGSGGALIDPEDPTDDTNYEMIVVETEDQIEIIIENLEIKSISPSPYISMGTIQMEGPNLACNPLSDCEGQGSLNVKKCNFILSGFGIGIYCGKFDKLSFLFEDSIIFHRGKKCKGIEIAGVLNSDYLSVQRSSFDTINDYWAWDACGILSFAICHPSFEPTPASVPVWKIKNNRIVGTSNLIQLIGMGTPVEITGNELEFNSIYGIPLWQKDMLGLETNTAHAGTISGNKFISNETGVRSCISLGKESEWGWIDKDIRGLDISNNTFDGYFLYGVLISDLNGPVKDLDVKDNTFSGIPKIENKAFIPACLDSSEENPMAFSYPFLQPSEEGVRDEGLGLNASDNDTDYVDIYQEPPEGEPGLYDEFPNGLTFALWAKPIDKNAYVRFLGFGQDGGEGYCDGNYSLNFSVGNNGTDVRLEITGESNASENYYIATEWFSPRLLQIGEWHHYAVTLSYIDTGEVDPETEEPIYQAEVKIFKDGVEQEVEIRQWAESPVPIPIPSAKRDICRIGRGEWSPIDQNFKGYMDDIAIWKRPLGPLEIAALGHVESGNPAPQAAPNDLEIVSGIPNDALISFYPCNSGDFNPLEQTTPGEIQFLLDHSGNGYNGRINYTGCRDINKVESFDGVHVYVSPGCEYCSIKHNTFSNSGWTNIILAGNNNYATNNTFDMPGFSVDENGDWTGGAIVIEGMNNTVNAVGTGFDICNQVIDRNGYDPEKQVMFLDMSGYWDSSEGFFDITPPARESTTLIDLWWLGMGPVFLARCSDPSGSNCSEDSPPSCYIDPGIKHEAHYNWGWIPDDLLYGTDREGDILTGQTVMDYDFSKFNGSFEPYIVWEMLDWPAWGPIWDIISDGAWSNFGFLHNYEGYIFVLMGQEYLAKTTEAATTVFGEQVPKGTEDGGVPAYTDVDTNFIRGYEKCSHAPKGFIEKIIKRVKGMRPKKSMKNIKFKPNKF